MAGPIRDPQVTQQQETKSSGLGLIEVADFLFGVKSIERIAKGEGSWGDLVNVGVTAATFFIPPAKLLKLKPSQIDAIVKSANKVLKNDIASEAAKRAAQRTLDSVDNITTKKYSRQTDEFGNVIEESVKPATPEEMFAAKQRGELKKQAEDIYEAKPKLKEEDIKPAQMTPEEKAFAKKFDEEMPPEPVKAPEAGKATVINRQTGELEFVDPRRLSPEAQVPKRLSVSPEVDQVGYALYKVEQLTRANIALKRSGKLDEVAKNLDEIAKLNEQIKTIGRTLSPKDAAKAGKLSEQLDNLRSVKYKKFNPDKARQELDSLREQWRNTTNVAERNKLKQQAKVIADRLKKMEGK